MSSSSSYADIISRPPFYPITGVNSSAPIPQQMEQIDQLNTLLLQEIDANFARLHNVVTSRILPEVKRFALANQPTREAAVFWRNFYVQAFGERPGEGSTLIGEGDDRTQYEDTSALLSGTETSSFFDPPPGTSSTPLRAQRDPEESYDDSVGSPFDLVDRQLSRLSMSTSTNEPTPSLPSGYSGGFGRDLTEESTTEFDSTLRYQPTQLGSPSPTPRAARVRQEEEVSPTLYRSPAPNTRLIDLTSTPLGTDFRPLAPSAHSRNLFGAHKDKGDKKKGRHILDDDDVELGMSPPVTMKFALPPTAQRIVNAGTTPIKASQTARDLDDLIDNMSDYEPSPRMPTPENLRRYSVMPGDLEAARRLFDAPIGSSSPASSPQVSSNPFNPASVERANVFSPPSPEGAKGNVFEPQAQREADRNVFENNDDDTTYGPGHRTTRRSLANTSFGSDIEIQRDVTGRIIGDDESIDNEDDSFSDGDTGTGSGYAAYTAQAHAGFELVDNSYDSDMSYAQQSAGETSVFGGRAVQGNGGRASAGFALHQQDEMVTYHGGRLEEAAPPDSPTRRR